MRNLGFALLLSAFLAGALAFQLFNSVNLIDLTAAEQRNAPRAALRRAALKTKKSDKLVE